MAVERKVRVRWKICSRDMYFAIEIQKIKSKEADADLDILNLDIFSLPLAEFLERHQFASGTINRDGFRVQHKGLRILLEALKMYVSIAGLTKT
jgi:hypothetical protein